AMKIVHLHVKLRELHVDIARSRRVCERLPILDDGVAELVLGSVLVGALHVACGQDLRIAGTTKCEERQRCDDREPLSGGDDRLHGRTGGLSLPSGASYDLTCDGDSAVRTATGRCLRATMSPAQELPST